MEMKIKLSKEDWEKMLKEANIIYKDMMLSAIVAAKTAELAREHLKKLDDGKNKKLSEEVQSASGSK